MNRWGVRIAGLILLLFFALVFVQMYKQLELMQRMHGKPATTSTTT